MKFIKFFIIFIICVYSEAQIKKIKIAFSDDTVTASPKYVDLVLDIYKQLGIEVSYQIFPSIRAIKVFNDGEFQALGARIDYIKDYSPSAILIEPPVIADFKLGLIGLPTSTNDEIDYNKDVFIVIRGNFTSKVIKDHFKIKNILEAKSTLHAIELLKNKRGKWITSSDLAFLSLQDRNDFIFNTKNTLQTSIYHVISKDVIELKPKLDALFQKAKEQGYFEPKKIIIKEVKPLVEQQNK